jgi:hypothetical protein
MGGLDVRRVVARCRVRSDSPLEGDGFELPVPREKGWSFDGSPSSAPFKSLRVSTKTTRFSHEGPMVRIRLPPAESPCLTQTRPLQVENRGFRAGVRGWLGDWVGRDAQIVSIPQQPAAISLSGHISVPQCR